MIDKQRLLREFKPVSFTDMDASCDISQLSNILSDEAYIAVRCTSNSFPFTVVSGNPKDYFSLVLCVDQANIIRVSVTSQSEQLVRDMLFSENVIDRAAWLVYWRGQSVHNPDLFNWFAALSYHPRISDIFHKLKTETFFDN